MKLKVPREDYPVCVVEAWSTARLATLNLRAQDFVLEERLASGPCKYLAQGMMKYSANFRQSVMTASDTAENIKDDEFDRT